MIRREGMTHSKAVRFGTRTGAFCSLCMWGVCLTNCAPSTSCVIYNKVLCIIQVLWQFEHSPHCQYKGENDSLFIMEMAVVAHNPMPLLPEAATEAEAAKEAEAAGLSDSRHV